MSVIYFKIFSIKIKKKRKALTILNVSKDAEQLELSYMAGGKGT